MTEADHEGTRGDKGGAGMVAQTAAAAGGATIGFMLGGPLGAIAGAAMTPALQHAMERAAQELVAWRRGSSARVLAGASQQLSIEPDEVVGRAGKDSASAQLLAETLFAAARTLNEQKIEALSRALANGLRDDDARPEEQLLVVAALAGVDEAHIKVLTHLGPERIRTSRSAPSRMRTPKRTGSNAGYIADSTGLTLAGARSVLAVLQRAGMAALDTWPEVDRTDRLIMELQEEVNKLTALVMSPPKNGKISSSQKPRRINRPGRLASPGWVITEFGEVCLDYLEGRDADWTLSPLGDDPDEVPLGHGEGEFHFG